MGKTKEQNRGITLIALIITIIIMLILVAVTINMAINGGLFSYAGKAVADMQNAIDLEQQLANGRIQIGGVWYDSIDDYIKGIPSDLQTEQDIIITASIREENGSKYIDLAFQVAGLPTFEEYANEYIQDGLLKMIDANFYPQKTIADLEEEVIDLIKEDETEAELFLTEEGELNSEFKNGVVSDVPVYLGWEGITLPYDQSLRLYCCICECQKNGMTQQVIQDYVIELMYLDLLYCYGCEILGLEPAYETTAIENQGVLLAKKMGQEVTLDDDTRAALQAEADEIGITYNMYLKLLILEEAFGELLTINVTVSNGDTFEADPIAPYSYQVTEEGTYTFKAELQDGSGRKGETTISTTEISDNWVMAWVCEDGVWSDTVEAGGTAEGDIIAKLYETGETITPPQGLFAGYAGMTLEEGPGYKLVIEGTGDMGLLFNDSTEGECGAWQEYSVLYSLQGNTVDYFYPAYITSVDICDGITNIGHGAFFDFSSLKNVTIANSVTKIEDCAFWCAYSLTEVTIPDNVKTFGELAFASCESLINVNIPEGTTNISDEMFMGCESLVSVNIPDSVTSIGANAFSTCKKLESISIPDGVVSIGHSAFNNCLVLTAIELPEGITSIEVDLFLNCPKLQSITLPSTITSIGANAFQQISEDAIIYVPNATVEALVLQNLEEESLSYTVKIQ